MFSSDTITAIGTPPGEGGIAIVRVSGTAARGIAAQVFRPIRGGNPSSFGGYTVHYGQFVEEVTGEIADDGLLTVFHAPHSYTGEDALELACHGGRATTERVLRLVLNAGAQIAEPGEFTLRAFLNGKLDLAQAEAVADVIRARTDSVQRMARRQLDGTLSKAILALREVLIGILAAIEVTIDFSEEVGDLEYAPLQQRISEARREVERLLATAERGRILREGLRVAIVGRPNVGKSSLLNALLRAERAIVTPVAGTTRDLVEETANLGGLPVVLVDTAGLRETADLVERIGVERARQAIESADMVLFVLDASAGWTAEEQTIAEQLAHSECRKILFVINKCDLVEKEVVATVVPPKSSLPFLPAGYAHVSAQSGMGIDTLETLLQSMTSGETDGNTPSVVVSNARHREALEAARGSLQEAERTAGEQLPGDFIAIDVRGALDALGLITGETVTEEIIHRIFHDFCVGK